MTEYRRAKRKHATEVIDVFDCMTEQVIGRISNLSETGMMLMCSQPPFDDALFQFRFTVNDEQGRSRPVEVGAHHLWTDKANSPGQHWAGFRFIDVTPECLKAMRGWVEKPGGTYV